LSKTDKKKGKIVFSLHFALQFGEIAVPLHPILEINALITG